MDNRFGSGRSAARFSALRSGRRSRRFESSRPDHSETFVMVQDNKKTQALVLFEGRVQGVGFRYSVCSIATGYRVKGYVKNLFDGGVELCVEGDSDEVIRFIGAVESGRLKSYIVRVQKSWLDYSGLYNSFSIKF